MKLTIMIVSTNNAGQARLHVVEGSKGQEGNLQVGVIFDFNELFRC